MTPELVEWQRIDPDNGLVEPWWTFPSMDVIKKWDLHDKVWLEFGAGLSTAWLRSKCKWVDSIESNKEWAKKAEDYCQTNFQYGGMVVSKNIPDGNPNLVMEYLNLIPKHYGGLNPHTSDGTMLLFDRVYDIISVDGIYRDECLQWAIDHFKGRTGILVVDNLDQDFVWISERAMKIIEPYDQVIYVQPDHFNNEGKPWNTRIIHIPA